MKSKKSLPAGKGKAVVRPEALRPTTGAPKPVEVAITPAKGRPMLHWVGKRPLSRVRFFPAQHIETFAAASAPAAWVEDWRNWPSAYPKGGLLFHGDNKEVLGHLLANGFRGKVSLVCIDPPFDSGADYVRRVTLRGPKGTAKIEGESYTLGEQIQYTDIWANDNYLQFMYERLMLLRELMSPTASLFLHVDPRKAAHLRLLLDEVFGSDTFKNQIAWRRAASHGGASRFGSVTDHILFYGPDDATWYPQYQEMSREHLDRHYRHEDKKGKYALGELTAPGIRRGPTGEPWRGFDVTSIGRHWATSPAAMDRFDADGLIYWPEKAGGWPRLKRYLEDMKGRPATDFWDDIDPINMVGLEREGYPTQKPEMLLARIITAASKAGDLVLDCFLGSGTTAAVAQKLGRRWIGCDINKGAIQTTSKRLQTIIKEQYERTLSKTERLPGMAEEPSIHAPAQATFSVWRVNDYDLAIQHNEAVNVACEKIGVERKRTDAFFDGTLGKTLVKIVPFGHALTPLDLEEVKRELEARPEEDRPVTVVALGVEVAATAWAEDWNRLRKRKDAVNRIDVIDLRTDPKHGGFIRHEPARARVKITLKKDMLLFEIEDFISPTIIQRLREQANLLKPKIDDWRAMVDCVMVDSAYDSKVFKVAVSDVPERKTDLVVGKYQIPAPAGGTTVAVKIIDMLGEEVVVTQEV